MRETDGGAGSAAVFVLWEYRPRRSLGLPRPLCFRRGGIAVETRHYAFFQNRECERFPCHAGVAEEDFNCLFCYCPLYTLGERCGGQFTYTERGIKSCVGCAFPHVREHYDAVLARFPELAELARRNSDGDRVKENK